ncbi:nonstructural protein [robinz microvirus RP_92]|nr:nonstructural protein [robinz microvirus RP_92]
MVLGCYCVLDKAVSAFMTPFFCRSDAESVRSFRDACSNPEHQFNRHLPDYVLYRTGSFDDSNGQMNALDSPVMIIAGLSLKSD